MAEQFVPAIEAAGVGAEEPFHARDEVGVGRLNHQMKMISHKAIRVNLPVGLGTGLAERFEEQRVVALLAEYGFPAITTARSRFIGVHEVINRAGIFDAQCAGHGQVLRLQQFSVNSED